MSDLFCVTKPDGTPGERVKILKLLTICDRQWVVHKLSHDHRFRLSDKQTGACACIRKRMKDVIRDGSVLIEAKAKSGELNKAVRKIKRIMRAHQ